MRRKARSFATLTAMQSMPCIFSRKTVGMPRVCDSLSIPTKPPKKVRARAYARTSPTWQSSADR